jgi:hypothetical protein
MPEAAFVATTEQETFVAGRKLVATVNFEPVEVQPAPVTAYETAPFPDPPLIVKVTPLVPLEIMTVFEVLIARVACVAGAKVTKIGAEINAAYIPLAAFVAVTEQVPVEALLLIVPTPVVALLVVAVQPVVVVANERAPAPFPPDALSPRAVPAIPFEDAEVSETGA